MPNRDRLLLLLQTLQKQSDEDTWLTTADLLSVLEKKGHECTVRSLRRDIQSLQNNGFDIVVSETEGRPTRYSWQDRPLEATELQVLIDAVSAAQFIPQKRSDQLVARLAEMGGPSNREKLKPQIMVSEHVKAKNADMIYTVQKIREAMDLDRKIGFNYLRYNVEKKQVPKHAGSQEEEYVVSPYATVWNNDRYYLVGWSDKRKKVAVYRIDRMKVPDILKQKRIPAPDDFDIRDYTDKVFWMFDGIVEDVTLRCRTCILDQVIDRFGEGIQIRKVDEGIFDVTVPVAVTGTFFAWVFQFVGEMKIMEPKGVRDRFAYALQEALDDALE